MLRLVARHLDGSSTDVTIGGEPLSIGRVDGCDLRLDFDTAVSRQHGTIVPLPGGRIRLECRPESRNGFLMPGIREPKRAVELSVGEAAVVGKTRLRLEQYTVESSTFIAGRPVELPDEEFTIRPLSPQQVADDNRLSVLSRLPSILDQSSTEDERLGRVVSLVLVGVKSADSVAIATRIDESNAVLAWDRRRELDGPPPISNRLLAKTLATGETVMHRWHGGASGASGASEITFAGNADWVFCTPIDKTQAIVVIGHGPAIDDAARQIDAKFVEVVAELLATERENRRLAGRLGQMRQFFSAPVMRIIETAVSQGTVSESELLAPRECDLAVLFCDLRGFSAGVERSSDLLGELERVRLALGVMTEAVLAHGGVTGEFLGDAVLGFWGWPLESDSAAVDCCRAALQIARDLGVGDDGQPRHGIGLAYGRAVAGRITTGDRTSINAFGPALNLASRLQALTKQLGVPIAMDDAMRERVGGIEPSEGRVRLLGRVVPYGLSEAVDVSELTMPASVHPLGDDELARYEQAVRAFIDGDWDAARERLATIPECDSAAAFLRSQLAGERPKEWSGLVRMDSK